MGSASRWCAMAALALGLNACGGNVIEGLRFDGGDAATVIEAGSPFDPAATGATRDSGPTDGGRDEATQDAGSTPMPTPSAERDLSSDPSRFFGAPRCDALGARLCDDFESEGVGARPDSTVWQAAYGYLPEVDDARAARGQKSLHFHLTGSMPGHIEETRTFPAPANTIFGRMFVWFDVLPSTPSSAQWSVVTATDQDGQTEVRIGGQPVSENRLGVGSRRPGEGGWDWHTAGMDGQSRPRTGSWICLEWQFKGDTHETRVWIDGQEQTSLHLTATDYRPGEDEGGRRFEQPAYRRLRIGWWLYPTEDPQPAEYDVWIDEVAVDDERIGCAD